MTRGGIVGSPRYMSPEQVAGDQVDHRSDLYSLGVIFFEMLTGTPPFRAKTAQAVLSQHLSARVPRLEEACPGIQIAPQLEKASQKSAREGAEQASLRRLTMSSMSSTGRPRSCCLRLDDGGGACSRTSR